MLEIKSVSWRNFMSYGDYLSHVELGELGQCLITGRVEEDSETKSRSNGAGKSTIPNVIQWVLFGRTMHTHNPGDNVINYHTGKECWGKVEFKNGDYIIRARKLSGENELIFGREGDETKFTSATLSTSKNQQLQLNKRFGLDYELFCASVFFNQYNKPWMEMADATRKKALERILHVDKFTSYAQIAKAKVDQADLSVTSLRSQIASDENRLKQIKDDIQSAEDDRQIFESSRSEKSDKYSGDAADEQKSLDAINIPDIEKLKKKWELIAQVEKHIEKMRKEYNDLVTEQSKYVGQLQDVEGQIKNWRAKEGKVCTSCSQHVNKDHICTKIDPIVEKKESISTKITELKAKSDGINEKITKSKEMLAEKRPALTLLDAQSIINDAERRKKRIDKLKKDAEDALKEPNPYDGVIEKYNTTKSKLEQDIADKQTRIDKLNVIQQHYQYIYKSYNDRNKIKGYVFKEHVPYINERLKYYFDIFGLDIKITLTDSLTIDSNLWGYEFQSGGERKRTDVAFMLATFDFHERMYGRQCNIMVLDEVDGRMDDDGIDALISIIKGELATKVETVLVISHRDMMFDTFDKEIKVVRKDRFSYLDVA